MNRDERDILSSAVADALTQVVLRTLKSSLAHHGASDGDPERIKVAVACPDCMDLVDAVRSLGLALSRRDPLAIMVDAFTKLRADFKP